MIFNTTGGANPLNFYVKTYSSEVELKEDKPKENTIGVATTNPITSWYFAPNQPENMAEGEVWFLSGTYSTTKFNALKKNNIMVYPSGAKQMVSGALKDVVAKTYQNGKWIDWIVYLFNDGKVNENFTGGFEKYIKNSQSDAVINSDGIYITCKKYDSSFDGHIYFAVKKSKDLSQYTKLCAKVAVTGGPGGFDIGVSTTANPTTSTTIARATAHEGVSDISVNLDSVNGECYAFLNLWFYIESPTASVNLSATVTEFWLE